jgi:hypothetical protein
VESCIMWEEIQGSRFYQVPDPEDIKTRIQLVSRSGTYLFVQAKRLGSVSRDYVPQQSDYVRHWEAASDAPPQYGSSGGWRSKLKNISPLRSAVFFVRGLRHTNALRPLYVEANYRQRGLKRNTQGFLTPLEGLRVRL